MNQLMHHENEVIVHERSVVHLKFTAQWKDETGVHTAIQHIEKYNVWRDMDLLPQELIEDILHKTVGQGKTHRIDKTELQGEWQSNLVKTLPRRNFTSRLRSGEIIIPKAGRYYPKGWLSGVDGVYSENMFPVRIISVDDDSITVDYNHPLASYEIEISVDIIDIFPPVDEHGGRCSDGVDMLLNNGPGMQMAVDNKATDFFSESAFQRVDESSDSSFYQQLRKVHHLDAYARDTITQLYGRLIKPGSHALDFMASWESHVPDHLSNIDLSGLGMNADELKANPSLSEYLIQDLNENSCLTYDNDMFDAVICTASVEYLVQPLKVFKEIKRVTKSGGVFIVTFSNRWFPAKAISIWSEMHDFERVGLVMEYFRQSGWNGQINTLSSRGQHRPVDDPHYAKTQMSDPVYAVWCKK